MGVHVFYSEDMGKTYFPHACINQNQLNQVCLNWKEREEGKKKEKGKKGKAKYKNFYLWEAGGREEIPNNQETFKVHITLAVK